MEGVIRKNQWQTHSRFYKVKTIFQLSIDSLKSKKRSLQSDTVDDLPEIADISMHEEGVYFIQNEDKSVVYEFVFKSRKTK
jgi:hypothetical protein